jgi:hypothetical protein
VEVITTDADGDDVECDGLIRGTPRISRLSPS